MNLYDRDPTLPDTAVEQADEQRLQEMWPEFEKLARAENAIRESIWFFSSPDLGGESFEDIVEDLVSDAVYTFCCNTALGLLARDPVELVEPFYQEVYRTISSPEARIKEAAQ